VVVSRLVITFDYSFVLYKFSTPLNSLLSIIYLSFVMDPKIRQLYKTLLYMGRDYPAQSGGYTKFRLALKSGFQNTQVSTSDDLDRAVKKGEFVIKELEAMYFLMRYRDMKRKYYS